MQCNQRVKRNNNRRVSRYVHLPYPLKKQCPSNNREREETRRRRTRRDPLRIYLFLSYNYKRWWRRRGRRNGGVGIHCRRVNQNYINADNLMWVS